MKKSRRKSREAEGAGRRRADCQARGESLQFILIETEGRPAPGAHFKGFEGNYLESVIRLIKGIIVGIGAILPGLSGGVMMVIFGLYDPLLSFLSDIRKNFAKNVRFFFPVIAGAVLGVVAFSYLVEKALGGRFEAASICLFIGFVVGTFPSLYKTSGEQGRPRSALIAFLVAGAGLFALMLMGDVELMQIGPSLPIWYLAGMLIGFGFIVPGLSPSNFLIYFGLYYQMAERIKSLDIPVILALGLGVASCALLFSRLMKRFLKRYYAVAYHIILGLVVASSLAIFPTVVFPAFGAQALAANGWTFVAQLALCLLLFVLGVVCTVLFGRLERKYEHKSLFD